MSDAWCAAWPQSLYLTAVLPQLLLLASCFCFAARPHRSAGPVAAWRRLLPRHPSSLPTFSLPAAAPTSPSAITCLTLALLHQMQARGAQVGWQDHGSPGGRRAVLSAIPANRAASLSHAGPAHVPRALHSHRRRRARLCCAIAGHSNRRSGRAGLPRHAPAGAAPAEGRRYPAGGQADGPVGDAHVGDGADWLRGGGGWPAAIVHRRRRAAARAAGSGGHA